MLNPGVPDRPASLPQVATELWELVVAYFKQETAVPLQRLGRVLAMGLLGALLLGFGVVFVTLAALRALQTETGSTFTGNWSWVPYLIVTVALVIGGALTWMIGTRRKHQREAA